MHPSIGIVHTHISVLNISFINITPEIIDANVSLILEMDLFAHPKALVDFE